MFTVMLSYGMKGKGRAATRKLFSARLFNSAQRQRPQPVEIMRLGAIAALALVLPATTSYAYTEGWQPGQSYTKYMTSTSTTGSAPASIPTKGSSSTKSPASSFSLSDLKSLFSLEEILTKGPVSRVIQKFGFNVTAQLEMAREGIPPRFAADIPLLTDANYEDELLNEQYVSPQEEDERTWAIMV